MRITTGKYLPSLFFAVALIFATQAALPPEAPGSSPKVIPLNEETVFCIYHKLENDPMEDQDVEDLLSYSGAPAFSPFKPAEMFTKNTLGRAKERLGKKVRSLDPHALFQWVLPLGIQECKRGVDAEGPRFLEDRMPHPTSLIRARLTGEGFPEFRKGIRRLAERVSRGGDGTEGACITVYLRVVGAQYSPETRNIALEDVLIPTGHVVFRPVKIEVLAASPGKRILSRKDGKGSLNGGRRSPDVMSK
ncbi:MAG: hypothetical protein JW821_18900 [Deltaproteobacteria bacterium]|nr:hypothetical protein [Deltaproteobacteria bacterium]